MKKVIKYLGLGSVGLVGVYEVMAVTGEPADVYEPAPISTPTYTKTPTSFNTDTPVATFIPTDAPVPPTETPISPTNTPVPLTDTPAQSIQEPVKDAQHYKNKCGVGARGWVQGYDGEVETLRKLSQPIWIVIDSTLNDNDDGWVVARCFNETDAERISYALTSMTPKEE